jgi:hypothetical protein
VPGGGRRPVADEPELDERRTAVLHGLSVERERVGVAAEDAGRELVERARVADLALRNRRERNVLLQERRDAGPLGVTPPEDQLVVGEREDGLDGGLRRCLRAHGPPSA